MTDDDDVTTWRESIAEALEWANEGWADVVANTLTDAEMDVEFDCGFGEEEGKPFTLWTHSRVYFPACYDGKEWVASVPRHPNGVSQGHIGGG